MVCDSISTRGPFLLFSRILPSWQTTATMLPASSEVSSQNTVVEPSASSSPLTRKVAVTSMSFLTRTFCINASFRPKDSQTGEGWLHIEKRHCFDEFPFPERPQVSGAIHTC